MSTKLHILEGGDRAEKGGLRQFLPRQQRRESPCRQLMNMLFFVVINLLIYLPLHLFEEGMGDFPRWMFEHRWLPHHMSYGHWMANNLFVYYPLLLISAALFVLVPGLTCFGVAVLVWGIINFGDHFFYTIRDRKMSPGLVTGILFLVNSVIGLKDYVLSDAFSVGQLTAGILLGGVLFGLPIGLCVILYRVIDRHFR